ncbi:MAG: pilus assembly PilX N-terminal domain-containing protein [Patescibacteria group bacterium]
MKNQKGFTLLLSALIASIVLALGTSIFQLAHKELKLSSIGRDSQFAFYAADTGAECAQYWDYRYERFPTTTPTSVAITCDRQDKMTTATQVGNTITSSFQFAPNDYCVNVSVIKSLNVVGNVVTTINADGFSANCEAVTGSLRVLQRSVRFRY